MSSHFKPGPASQKGPQLNHQPRGLSAGRPMEDLRQSIINLKPDPELLQRDVKKAKCVVPVAAAITAKIGPSVAISMYLGNLFIVHQKSTLAF